MSKRQLLVTVDCGGKRCKRCEHGSLDNCDMFDELLQCDERERLLRLPACHKAEEDAKRGECPVDDETLDAWDVLARAIVAQHALGVAESRCAKALATAVEALRQLRAPGNLPSASTVESAELQWTSPPVFTFEGKVKP